MLMAIVVPCSAFSTEPLDTLMLSKLLEVSFATKALVLTGLQAPGSASAASRNIASFKSLDINQASDKATVSYDYRNVGLSASVHICRFLSQEES